MNARTTRRGFVGGGVAVAAGFGVARLPEFVGRSKSSLAYDIGEMSAAGALPAFGTLRPTGGETRGPLSGTLRKRGSSRVAGHVTITSIPSNEGILQVHTLDLHDGTVTALGLDTESVFKIASGTGRYAGAQGRVTIRGAKTTAPSLDVDLEL
jgi:hypothetical protein